MKKNPLVLTYKLFMFMLLVFVLSSCSKEKPAPDTGTLQLSSVKADNVSLNLSAGNINIPVNSTFTIAFSSAINTNTIAQSITIIKGSAVVLVNSNVSNEGASIVLIPKTALDFDSDYIIRIANSLKGANNESFAGVDILFKTEKRKLELVSIHVNSQVFQVPTRPKNINFQDVSIVMTFSDAIKSENLNQIFSLSPSTALQFTLSADKKTLTAKNTANLDYYRKYSFQITTALQSVEGANFDGFVNFFLTGLNPSYKFPVIDDEELLDLVQSRTFRYFWDFAHPNSGLARERNSSGDIVTIGGSGFGIMAIPIAIERGFISRQQGIERIQKITLFLSTADRFHGVWPHWMNGTTGKTVPFSTYDNGGDLVETSFMAAGLLTVRQYLNPSNASESIIINRINQLLAGIEWSWYTRQQNVLYWHWSPNYEWRMNMQVKGYNEALITYFMAATSTTFPISAAVYHNGWASSSYFVNGRTFYGIPLPLGFDYGGPLFFSHYSFLGLNPTGLSDQYANYWTQNVNHSRINRQHCVLNPRGHLGYSADCWGLTASDEPTGYGVHEPTRDNGTISPTAALSSMPYTPNESKQAMRHFYYVLGDKLWGEYGFKDAFNPEQSWWANSYLAIDQGPIIVMIENHRSGLCWNLFMSAPEVQAAMIKLGFTRK